MSGFSTAEDISLNKTIEESDLITKTAIGEIDNKYEIDKCADWINKHEFKELCLQFPDKLLVDSAQVLLNIKSKVECNLYILGDTSYGSCCVDEVAAEHIKADSIIHFGHACLGQTKRLPVLYIFEKSKIDIEKFIQHWKATFENLNSNIVLFYDVSYYHYIDELTKELKEYTNLAISQLALTSTDGQIVGRYFDKTKVGNSFASVYIGSDNQTFTNVSLSYNLQDCLLYDPSKSEGFQKISPMDSRWLKRRMFLVEKCKDAKTIGILIGTLAIDGYLEAIKYIQSLTKAWNKKSYIVAVGKPNAAKLANFPEMDLFVLIGCPENTLYNDRDFYKPVITLFELDLALNPSRLNSDEPSYVVDISQLLPGGSLYKTYDEKNIKSHDISLITGQMRSISHDNEFLKEVENYDRAVSLCGSKELMLKEGALTNRSWRGLEQNLGETLPQMAVPGRSGVPMSYTQEPSEK